MSGKRMRRSAWVNWLSGENIHAFRAYANTLELRQMWMKVERLDSCEKALSVQRSIDIDPGWRAICGGCRSQSKGVFHWHCQTGKQCARKATETLARRNGSIAMVKMFR
jgi:hypothetical protein